MTSANTDYLEKNRKLVEDRLETLIAEHDAPYSELFQAARYSLLGNAKRLRPILAIATAEVLNGKHNPNILSAACTLEIIHTYSLIHDDLPSMDNDDFRRGKPSLHKAYTEGMAVLAGDFLLTVAFEIISNDPNLTAEQKVKLFATLAKNAGGHGMIGGQVMDITSTGKKLDLAQLRLMHSKKTGALITASIEFGGILSNASVTTMGHLRTFGDHIGLAFQIVDDILDITSSYEKHGKKESSDIANQKSTYVSLLGMEKAKKTAQEHFEASLAALNHLPEDTTLLKNIAEKILNRNH